MAQPQLLPGEANRNRVIGRYRRKCKKKNLSFNLNIEQCEFLFKSNCIYCNYPPKIIERASSCPGEYVYNSIDRIDSSKGYEVGNVVPCCHICNISKIQMTSEQFINLMQKITQNAPK